MMKLKVTLFGVLTAVSLGIVAPYASAATPEEQEVLDTIHMAVNINAEKGRSLVDHYRKLNESDQYILMEANAMMMFGAGLCFGIAEEDAKDDIAKGFKDVQSPLLTKELNQAGFDAGYKRAKQLLIASRYDDISSAKRDLCPLYFKIM